jgi:AcrR family transcriptional regulator
MASLLTKPERIVPQQKRASLRIESFLDAAAEIIADVGYEAATMTAIAERSGSAIGALYRYFPDKLAVARALLIRYAQENDQHWASLIEDAKELSLKQFADRLVGLMAEFAEERPAYLPLINAPIRFARDPAARQNLRDQFSKAFIAKNPELSRERAFLISNVVVQIMKGLIQLYAATPARERASLMAEFKLVLTAYLANVLQWE